MDTTPSAERPFLARRYAALYAEIVESSIGRGETTFNLPDLRDFVATVAPLATGEKK